MTKRIGIFGGAFDPVHAGHIGFALAAIKKANLDKVYLLVESKPRHKTGVTHMAHRLAMAKLATARHSKLGVLEMPDQQFSVAKTLPRLKRRFQNEELVLLIGSDLLDHISAWPLVDRLLEDVGLVVALRQQVTVNGVKQNVKNLPVKPKSLYIVHTPSRSASSGQIREDIKTNQQAKDLLPSLRTYVTDNWLYVSPESTSKRT